VKGRTSFNAVHSQCCRFAAEKRRKTAKVKRILSWLHYQHANLWALFQNQLCLGQLEMDLSSTQLLILRKYRRIVFSRLFKCSTMLGIDVSGKFANVTVTNLKMQKNFPVTPWVSKTQVFQQNLQSCLRPPSDLCFPMWRHIHAVYKWKNIYNVCQPGKRSGIIKIVCQLLLDLQNNTEIYSTSSHTLLQTRPSDNHRTSVWCSRISCVEPNSSHKDFNKVDLQPFLE